MKAAFRFSSPNMLAEAQAGDLFVPLGPDLVECVCAVRCVDGADGVRADMPTAARFDPAAPLTVVVIACRVGRGEPEYFPAGYCTTLSGAAPVQFLQQCEALQLQPRIERKDTAAETPAAKPVQPLYANLTAMQRDMDRINLARKRIDRALPHALARAVVETVVADYFEHGQPQARSRYERHHARGHDNTRPELASKL